jgi:hypothetical protein
MQVPENILNTVDQFHREWRHPRLEPLVCSALYSLFPEKTIDMPTVLNWPSQWPNDDRPGVYMIFGAERQLLYVGKSQWIGRRLSSYFTWSNGRNSGCRVVHSSWRTEPMFVATIPVAESFEGAAVEEFLIAKMNSEENRLLLG